MTTKEQYITKKKQQKLNNNQAYAALVFPSNNPDSYRENEKAIVTKFLERGENGQTAARFPITFGRNNPATTDEKQAEAILYARGKSGNNYNPQPYAGKNVTLDIFVESDGYGTPNVRKNKPEEQSYGLWAKVLAVLETMQASKMASLTLRLFNKNGQALDEDKELLSAYLKECLLKNKNNLRNRIRGIIGNKPVYIRETENNYGVELNVGPDNTAQSIPESVHDTTIIDKVETYRYHKIENMQLKALNHEQWRKRIARDTTVVPQY